MSFETTVQAARSAYKGYRNEIHSILTNYRTNLDRAKQESAAYKDEKGN